MKTLCWFSLISIVIFLFSHCDVSEQPECPIDAGFGNYPLPAFKDVFRDVPSGEISALLNGNFWPPPHEYKFVTAKQAWIDKEKIDLYINHFYDDCFYTECTDGDLIYERMYIWGIPFKIGRYPLSELGGYPLSELTEPITLNLYADGEFFINNSWDRIIVDNLGSYSFSKNSGYLFDKNADNILTIDSYDPSTCLITGTFSFTGVRSPKNNRPKSMHYPVDTLRFTQGKFSAYLIAGMPIL